MRPNVAQALQALPEDLREEQDAHARLGEIVEGLARRAPPTGRLHRLWALGSTEARIALGYAAWWGRSFLRDAAARDSALQQAHLNAALRLVAGMGYLRGAAMKVGQIFAAYPSLTPREYVELLESLHFDAPPMHFSLLREMVREELGGDPEEVFAEFDTRPFAAASLGQVHRARLHSGEEVAVKVQYPGIARAVRSDLRNLKMLLLPMRFSGDWDNLREQFRVLCDMLEQETDYRQEAEYMRRAHVAFEDEERIVVPRPHEKYCGDRVLTMDLLPGVHLRPWLARGPSHEQRDEAGRLISVALFRLFYAERFVFADPHPGNFLFMPDGRIGLIDFGCCHVFTGDEWAYITDLDRSLGGGREACRKVVATAAILTEAQRNNEEHMRLLTDMAWWLQEPLRTPGPFTFDETYMQRGFELFVQILRKRYTRNHPIQTWFHRFFFGCRAIFAEMNARIDIEAVYTREATPYV